MPRPQEWVISVWVRAKCVPGRVEPGSGPEAPGTKGNKAQVRWTETEGAGPVGCG